MPSIYPSDRLTSEDAVFLYLENETMPLHIGSVSIFDGPVPFTACVKYVESRLPLIPRYRQRIVVPPLNFGHPTWEEDPDFDIRNHIHHTRLKRGSIEELQELAGEIYGPLMDRTKPLWDITMIDGLQGGRSAMLCRIHHCLVDGVSGVGLLNVLLGTSPKPEKPPKAPPHRARPLPGPAAALADAMASSYSELLERIVSAQMAALNVAQSLVSDQAVRGLTQVSRLVPEMLTPVDLLPFNKPCLGPRKVAWTDIPIAEVSAIREVCGGKLNDVVLTVVTQAVRRYCELHGHRVKNRLLRLMVPVNMRNGMNDNGLGNRVSLLPVNIPLDIHDPLDLLQEVRERTEALKGAHVADFIHLLATWVGTTPAPLQALLGPLASMLPVPPFNMVCTNVPGPQVPLYALGRKMVSYYPYVPIGNQMAVDCAIQSYNQMLFFGFTADSVAAPDVGRLRDFLDASFAELRKAAGIGTRREKRPRVSRVRKPRTSPLNGAVKEIPAPLPEVLPPDAAPAMNNGHAAGTAAARASEAAAPIEEPGVLIGT